MKRLGKKSIFALRKSSTDAGLADESWSVSYGDLVTLLLVFFVILVGVSKVDTEKLEEVQNAIKGEQASESPKKVHIEVLERLIQQYGLSDAVTIVDDVDGILIVIKDSLLFESGRAQISIESSRKMRPIFEAFRQLPEYYHFSIEGHTDDAPIHTQQFPSNWHLASARAIAVLQLFEEEKFKRSRVSAHSFADTRPILANLDELGQVVAENRRRNRRVVIRVR